MFVDLPATTSLSVKRIVSGGQTGADRAALDWAIDNGLEHGGWCPQGRRAEDGLIDNHYELRETPISKYVQRTEWNVRDSDGTVVITIDAKLIGGTKQTVEFARKLKKPLLRLTRTVPLARNAAALRTFLHDHNIKTLNVAGTRASEEPEVAEFVKQVLDKAAEQSPPFFHRLSLWQLSGSPEVSGTSACRDHGSVKYSPAENADTLNNRSFKTSERRIHPTAARA